MKGYTVGQVGYMRGAIVCKSPLSLSKGATREKVQWNYSLGYLGSS